MRVTLWIWWLDTPQNGFMSINHDIYLHNKVITGQNTFHYWVYQHDFSWLVALGRTESTQFH
jgi:hypothetical protein